MRKHYVVLTTEERQKLKKLSKRKFISPNAKKQILVLLMFDSGGTITMAAEIYAVSNQTLMKWRDLFKEKRLDSLLIYSKKKVVVEEIYDHSEEEE